VTHPRRRIPIVVLCVEAWRLTGRKSASDMAVFAYFTFPLLLGGWVLAPIAGFLCALTIKPGPRLDSARL
jgi:hypothetical protein